MFHVFRTVVQPVDVIAVNASMFLSAGAHIVAGGALIAGGCLEPTPFEPATCAVGGAVGVGAIGVGVAQGAGAVYFFKNYTLPAIKSWGCSD